jgi:hypothetical protein
LLQKLQLNNFLINKIDDALKPQLGRMHLSFFMPLIAAAVSAYIYRKSADEMAYLAAAVLGVSLIVALVIAPLFLKVAGVCLLWASKSKLDLSF